MTNLITLNKKFYSGFFLAFFLFLCTGRPGIITGAALIPGHYGSTSLDIIPPSVNALPSLKNIVQGISSLEYPTDNQLMIHQDRSNAIIQWESFNIGADAWVHFDQQENSAWKALNRIYDQDPSLIYGNLTADGHVYLINQNGIFFSENSSINVGSLVASSLNIADEDFLDGTLSFVRENYIDPDTSLTGTGVVSNHGTITVDDAGSVFLLGTIVENNGEISAYLGWVALAAGDNVDIYQEENNDVISNIVSVQGGGDVYNYEEGTITADMGQAGMYGNIVTQNGMIRSITAVRENGRIELLATEKVVLGEESVTSSPISDSTEKVHESFPFDGGEIIIGGLDDDQPLERIEHYGTIEAPLGNVEMNAEERIYLGQGSEIDVSGLWISLPVSEKTLEVQLNSVELRDDYGQKDGILSGETITISALSGSSIGDISDYLSAEEKTAQEMALEGGTISLDAGSGDIILREGGLLDVSGGGINYTGGTIETTKLVSVNGVVYDISEAPEWETYSKILGEFEKVYERYGITETYNGIYYGGAAPLQNYTDGFQEGSDAGFISLIGSSMALDGIIDGSITQGLYQIYYPSDEDEELYDAMGLSVPTAGTLEIGDTSASVSYLDADPVVEEIVVVSSIDVLPDDYDASDPFPEDREGKTYVSSSLINDAELDTLKLYSRIGLSIAEDAEISLMSGGYFEGTARSIIHEGIISVPGGSIDFVLNSNITTDSIISGEDNPEYVSQEDLGHERIYLASGSSLSVAGGQIDNSLYGNDADYEYETGIMEGGSISISDETLYGEGVIVEAGALIDVSGGYEIDDTGDVSGGDAGSLSIQGVTVILDGDIMGYSVPGMDGGSITVHAVSVSVLEDKDSSIESAVGMDDDIPEELENSFIVDDDFFDDTGFTSINLTALDGIEISSGAVLTPSYLKYYVSAGDNAIDDYGSNSNLEYENNTELPLIRVTDEYLGDSSISLKAGEEFDGEVISGIDDISGIVEIDSDSEISVGPGGSIYLEGTYIESGGNLYAPGGDIEMDALGITLYSGSLLSAKGYTISDSEYLVTGLPVEYSTVDGGSVSLIASQYDIVIEPEAVLDVSGSEAVTDYTWDEDGSITTVKTASAAGSITLSFVEGLVMEGELKAGTSINGLNGGSLTIIKKNNADPLNIKGDDISSYVSTGFDSISLKNWDEIVFMGSAYIDIGRELTIDAPVVSASVGSNVSIASPWITLTNSYDYYEGKYKGEEGNAFLSLTGDFINIDGYVTLSSFQETELIAEYDISLSDYYYNRSSGQVGRWGGLDQTGALVMQADRIYPRPLTSFRIESSGDLTVLDNGDALSGSLYSAGSSLEIEADNIYLYGDIYAPLGEIILNATAEDGTVYLAEGSTLSTHTDARINYGLMDEEGVFWGLPMDSGSIDADSPVELAPTGSVLVEADEVIMAEGSEINVSGGGTVFAYQFLSGTAGSENPLEEENQYIILLDNSVYSPGETIVIGENSEIPAGEYYVLSEEYAFVEGAIVLTDLGTDLNPTEYRTTEEGYTVISGKSSVAGTDLESPEVHYYSIRSAEDVLDEGYFEISELTAGDGGNVSLKGSTTIIEGSISGEPLDDTYSGGTLELSGTNIILTAGDESNIYSLPDSYDPTKELQGQITEDLIGKLVLSDASVSAQGMEKVILGDEETTLSLTVEEGVNLELQSIEFNAGDEITVSENAIIAAISENGDGTVTFNSSEGSLYISETALIHASDNITLDAGAFDIQGQLQVDNSSISLTSDTIYFVSDDYTGGTEDGAYITESLWAIISLSEIVELGQGSEIIFEDSFDLNVSSEIIVDASLIETRDADIAISSISVTLLNSGDESGSVIEEGSGSLSIEADEIFFSEGTLTFGGFSEIDMVSSGDLIIQGTGGIITGDADLNMEGAGIISSAIDSDDGYDVMDYAIDAGMGAVTISSNDGSYADASVTGGNLEITAADIIQSGVLNMPGSNITLNATGSGEDTGIFFGEGALIYAAGDDYSPGGTVRLVSESGVISLVSGSEIDVSAGLQGNAGEIEIVSPSNAAVIEGDLKGEAKGGTGGSFSLDTAVIDELGDLIDILGEGGFDNRIELRARQGDIVLEESDDLIAQEVTISADGDDGEGDIDIYGSIDASGAEDGASVNVYAAGDLTLYSGSSIIAGLSEADIILSGMDAVTFEQGAEIDAGNGDEGSVTFRSLRTDTGVDMQLKGTVTGAGTVSAEAVKIYDDDDHDGVIDDEIDQWQDETDLYMTDAADIKETLFNDIEVSEGTELYFTPGIEIRSGDDLTIDDAWDLTDWRYDTDGDGLSETAGSLIVRAAGDLVINRDIKDSPTDKYSLWEDSELIGWNIGIYGGSDLSAADPMNTIKASAESGDITLSGGVLVYTERGNINFSSAGDTIINLVDVNTIVTPSGMGFNLATYSGSIKGKVGGSLIIDGGAIQSSRGNMDIEAEEDLLLKRSDGYMGTIRSLGTASSTSIRDYWEYEAGGSISLDVAGNIRGVPTKNDPWDANYGDEWAASYEGSYGQDVTQGIVAMSGGDITIKAGGDITAGIGIFGEGDLGVYSGGDLNGRFLVTDGTGELYAAGDFGKMTKLEGQHIELFDAQLSLTAGGTIELGAIVNPTLAGDSFTSDSSWNLGYTTETSVTLNAISGDVVLTGDTMFYGNINQKLKQKILPANLSISVGRDILLYDTFIMAPSSDGQLSLTAGRDINGQYISSSGQVKRAGIYLSDLDPDDVYGDMTQEMSGTSEVEDLLNSLRRYLHDDSVLHKNDDNKVVINAGQDIKNIAFYLPKKAEITAERDIIDIYYHGQNTGDGDISLIQAGGDISFSSNLSGELLSTGIVHGGPGILMVHAGNSVDLGTTDGIQLIGNQYNPYLSGSENDLVVLAGVNIDVTLDDLKKFFSDLQEAGTVYSELLAEGSVTEAEEKVEQTREEIIDPLFEDSLSKTGNIDMVESQINITGSSGGISMLARGEINVGKTTFSESGNVESDSGIYTTAGGPVNIFLIGDLNVNESRVMTFAGGHITVWSDQGDINAGRGSKTSVNATESEAVYDETTGKWSVVFEAPAVGSGIRTLTFDPDGLEGPEEEPLAGDVYLFAPEGEIDAGEAGISGTNVILGATEILNAQNISFSQESVGVSLSSGTVNLGSLAGVSSLTDTGSMAAEATSSISEAREEAMKEAMKALEEFIARWLNVEVIGFYED